MVSLRKLSDFTGKNEFDTYIEVVNSIRSHYQWSTKTYTKSNIDDVFLIKHCNAFIGFIEASYHDLKICEKRPVTLFLHEFHISPSNQGKGIGKATISALLNKGVLIEMVVVKQNKNMMKLINTFSGVIKYSSENTSTIQLSNTPNKSLNTEA